MTKALTILFLTAMTAVFSTASAEKTTAFSAEASLVEIEITKKSYDYRTPWNIRNNQTRKNGIIIGDGKILTTADGFSGQYLCRIRKGGISKQYAATLDWVDYYSNLAVLSVDDSDFWSNVQPVRLIDQLPQSGNVQVYRWLSGRIETRSAEIFRLYIGPGKMSYIEHLQLAASSEIDSAGWAEVVIDQGRLIGLTTSSSNDRINILPAPFIKSVLDGRAKDENMSAGYFDFSWMRAKNPAHMASKGFGQAEVGVVITEVGKRRLSENTLKEGDVLYAVDGFEIDKEGKYVDPDYGRLSINGLATRGHYAGDSIPMKVWRDGKEIALQYTLPKPDFDKSLIPEKRYDAAPAYLIAGGLVFQPLNGPLLQALGSNRPIIIDYYKDTAKEDRDGLVILTGTLPDDFNRGYESIRFLIVDQINSKKISSLEDVKTALEAPDGDFHKIQFVHDGGLQHIVLDAAELTTATTRILKHYRIPKAESL